MRTTTKIQIAAGLYLTVLMHMQAWLEWHEAPGNRHWALFLLQAGAACSVIAMAILKDVEAKP